jgi:hypothetical protein
MTGAVAAHKVFGRAAKTHTRQSKFVAVRFTINLNFQSRALGEFRKFWFSFFQKGIAPLLAFFAHIKKHGGIAGQFLQTGLTIAVGI